MWPVNPIPQHHCYTVNFQVGFHNGKIQPPEPIILHRDSD